MAGMEEKNRRQPMNAARSLAAGAFVLVAGAFVLAAVVALLGMDLAIGQEAAPAKTAEDRLLEAELMEISSGDLAKAKAIYEAMAADEKTPEPARARALLYLD